MVDADEVEELKSDIDNYNVAYHRAFQAKDKEAVARYHRLIMEAEKRLKELGFDQRRKS